MDESTSPPIKTALRISSKLLMFMFMHLADAFIRLTNEDITLQLTISYVEGNH